MQDLLLPGADNMLTQKKPVGVRISKSDLGSGVQRVKSVVIPSSKPVSLFLQFWQCWKPTTTCPCPRTVQPPNFVSWAFLKRNELAPDQGKRMFYTEEATGETIPDSDDEQDNVGESARRAAPPLIQCFIWDGCSFPHSTHHDSLASPAEHAVGGTEWASDRLRPEGGGF